MLYPVAQWLGLANSAVNPMVYAYFNKKFRHGEFHFGSPENPDSGEEISRSPSEDV